MSQDCHAATNEPASGPPLRIVIIGGVAGGASAAARARRVNAQAEICLLEQGPAISFANCGLPYHIGGEIADRERLLVTSPQMLWQRFRIDVRTGHRATTIDRQACQVHGIRLSDGEPFCIPYDRLILSPGAEPIALPQQEPADANVFPLWTLANMDSILERLGQSSVKHACVIGGGFVGLEVVEQLIHRGLNVTLIERNPQVLTPLDPEMAEPIRQELERNGVDVRLSSQLDSFTRQGNQVTQVCLAQQDPIDTDLVIVGAGVRPRTELAVGAGLGIGDSGGMTVNHWQQTSDPHLYAVGDATEYQHAILNQPLRMPLAGPANRAGRVAGAHAASGQSAEMGSVLGTAIVRVFGLTAATTGLSEKKLTALGTPHRSVIIQAPSHAGYYPGSESMFLKLIYHPDDGRILGAQAVGGQGVDKRIDIIATAMHFQGTVNQLAQLDLAYAPPFSSAKDPVHMAAFVAENDLLQAPSVLPPTAELDGFQVVDVRTTAEQQRLPLPGAVPIPIDELADRLTELDPERPTVVVCHSGKRAHVGACRLLGEGFEQVYNLSGGMAIRSLTGSQQPQP